AQAQPYIDKMLRHLEGKLGWPAGSMSGRYLPDGVQGSAELASASPGLALVDPSVYAGQQKALGMKVIAKVEVNGRGEETYSVVVRRGGPGSLAELKGRTVAGAVVHDAKYVANVIMGGALEAGEIRTVPEKRPLKALRDVVRGTVDAAVVDRAVIEHMAELDFAGEVVILHTSKPVPAPAVVVIGAGVPHASAIAGALVGMCGRPDGAELCKTLTLTSIKSASDADYAPLLKRYASGK
ncbi:MAG TPA: PhnD/SsuA/transferrin family substrate-binding protein, partial [Polyangia bacterium]|nr:PhnD/SsuA/transferrin family substrate-binding protein [Polyangia bacterium]